MRVAENVSLSSMTTMGVGGPAGRLVFAETADEIVQIVRASDAAREPLFVLGGGSNLVVGDGGVPGTVLRVASSGLAFAPDDDRVRVTAAAGEPWDAFVATMVAEGLSGVECLSGIPGLVGATPMQNVGAYGQDVAQTIVAVEVFDRRSDRIVVVDAADCGFGYRTSAFRAPDASPPRIVLAVTFELTRSRRSRPVRYAELAGALGVAAGEAAGLAAVRDAVLALRRGKGMVTDAADPDTWSAGSFFTNPLLDAPALAALRARSDAKIPEFPDPSGRTKVSAAWLIERAGFAKGHARGRAAVSHKHALALTNRGGATGEEIAALASEIRRGVFARFGVLLEPEPILVGVALEPHGTSSA